MKKLYRKGTVHPSPPLISDHLSFLPAAILTLAVALSPEDKEVLAYLISSSSSSSNNHHHHQHRRSTTGNGNSNSNNSNSGTTSASGRRSTDHHPASFNCYCFSCYMSYWVKWDSSPNRQLIHEIIDAFEDGPVNNSKKDKSRKKERRKNNNKGPGPAGSVKSHDGEQATNSTTPELLPQPAPDKEFPEAGEAAADDGGDGCGGGDGGEMEAEEEASKGTSVRRFVGFLGEKIWGIWS